MRRPGHPAAHVTLVACAAVLSLAPLRADAQQQKKLRFSFHVGPESSGFKGGAEDAFRQRGYADTSPAVTSGCYLIPPPCPGPIDHPRSWETGTETFMFSASYRMRRFAFNLLLTDGAAGETEGYRSGTGHEYVRFDEGRILGATALVGRSRFRVGAGPALMRVTTGDSTRSSAQTRPGLLGEAGVDLLRLGPLIAELRAQLRAFHRIPVTSQRGERYDVSYRSLFVGLGLGLEP